MESREEGGLVGDAKKGEGCVPCVGRREVDGEGEDAVAVKISSISGLPVQLL